MKSIGGYFELELVKGKEYHEEAIRLNTGRNAFEYIMLANNFTKVYLPFFTCDVLLEPLKKHKIEYEFYSIDQSLEPLFNYEKISSQEVFLYTNYFGLKDLFIENLASQVKNIIIDNSQSFFSKPTEGINTFYSPRKFFGLPDGGYLYTTKKLDKSLERDLSFSRFSHLLKRIDSSAEDGYNDFVENDKSLKNHDIKKMSMLTQSLLRTIDYDLSIEKRKYHFAFLHQELKKTNKFKIGDFFTGVPMVYPYWTEDISLRKRLLENKIYTPIYWKNVLLWSDKNSIEYKLVEEVIYLPIDHRYNSKDLNRILKIIFHE